MYRGPVGMWGRPALQYAFILRVIRRQPELILHLADPSFPLGLLAVPGIDRLLRDHIAG